MPTEPIIAVAIARQFGAGAGELGQRLAARFKLAYLDRAILRMAAERLGADEQKLAGSEERISGFWQRFIDSLAMGPPENIYGAVPEKPAIRDERLFELEAEIIREVASKRSCVVIGRGGVWILGNHPGAIRVLLHAPVRYRAAHVMRHRVKQDAEAVLKAVQDVDRERERFVMAMTGHTMMDAGSFDLCINTQSAGIDAAEEMVGAAIEARRAFLAKAL